jgi:hypothetical protein
MVMKDTLTLRRMPSLVYSKDMGVFVLHHFDTSRLLC